MQETFVTGEFSVDFTRIIDGYIFPTHLYVSYDVDFTDEATPRDVDRFFAKVKYWVENVMSKSVVVDIQCDTTADLAFGGSNELKIKNNIVMCPSTPDERLFAAVIACKLEAFGEGMVIIERVAISNAHSTYKVSYTCIGEDFGYILPEMDSWVGENTYYKVPWWHRSDLTTRDEELQEGADTTTPPAWAHDLKVSFDQPEEIGEPETKAEIIDFRNRLSVIEGDKKD